MDMVSNKREKERCVSSIFIDNPPWCSSGGTFGKRKFVPRRGSIQNVRERNIKRKSLNKHPLISACRNIILFIFFLLAIGLVLHRLSDKIPRDLMTEFLWSPKFIYPTFAQQSQVQECYHKIAHMSLQLVSAEKALRKALRVRKTGPEYELAHTAKDEQREVLIQDAKATRGADTTEWSTQVALWGLIPLWQAAPPPDLVLSPRPPTPSDCWPFSGSRGEVIVNLAKRSQVHRVSIEHVRPDTARSAPRDFTIYGTVANGTRIKLKEGVYQPHLPPKQYYSLQYKNLFWDKIAINILSNQGNLKYTCIYRLHLYKYSNSDLLNV